MIGKELQMELLENVYSAATTDLYTRHYIRVEELLNHAVYEPFLESPTSYLDEDEL